MPVQHRLQVFIAPLLVVLCCFPSLVSGQEVGTIYGVVTDAGNKSVLPYASVGIITEGLGSITDTDGTYRINNIPAGVQLVTVSYLGYETIEREVTVVAGKEVKLDFTIGVDDALQLAEVIVTGQAEGQRAAINQQINSNTIVNVVSKERLQELPDQNAAESVGRLSGVSVFRDAGEGQRISVRGISPRLNSVTINGQRLPSTEASDRSTDLSMISPDMLEGIELYKALTPDRDGDAIGGSVNFTVAKAREGLRGVVRVLGTYNGLAESFNNYRLNGSLSNRFGKDNKFGYLASFNYQQIDRSNEGFNVGYESVGINPDGTLQLPVSSFNLNYVEQVRTRGGGGLTLDFSPSPNHSIIYNGTAGYTSQDRDQWRRRYNISSAEQRLEVRSRENSTLLVSNSLNGEHHINDFTIDWMGSYSFSDQSTPRSLTTQFQELNATTGNAPDESDFATVPSVYVNNLDNTRLRQLTNNLSEVNEAHLTGQVDVQYDFRLSDNFTGFLKSGFKVRRITRGSDQTQFSLLAYLPSQNPAGGANQGLVTVPGGDISLANFLRDYVVREGFFNDQYDFTPGGGASLNPNLEGIDIGQYNAIFGTNHTSTADIATSGNLDPALATAFYEEYQDLFFQDPERDLEDYDGEEVVTSGYLMSQLNIGKKLMFVGGMRMEHTSQNYSSRIVAAREEGDEAIIPSPEQVEAGSSYTSWLPMAQARYKVAEWMDVRAAITKTLARPNFRRLVPWARINNSEQRIDRGKPDLLNTDALNYDLFVSFYNRFGLLTIGGFYKRLQNIDYSRESVIFDSESVFNGYKLTEPDNVPETIAQGVEVDLQINLKNSSSKFLQGFVIAGNVTLLNSETTYPFFQVNRVANPTPPPFFVTTITDTLRSAPLVGQSNLIGNFSLGYEIGGFSGRLSATYQGAALSPGNGGVGLREELDTYDDEALRMDLALRQNITKQFTVMFNVNNLLDTPERAFRFGSVRNLPSEEEFYGLTADLGFMWRF